MRRAKVVLVAVMTISLAGCVLDGKPKTLAGAPAPPQPQATAPAPPPEPLSIPQTHVDLPPPQPLNRDALVTAQPVEAPPPAQPKPAAEPRKPAPKGPAASSKPADPQTPAAEPEQPATRPPIQEIMSPDEQNRLRDSAHSHQAQANALLAAAKPHTANQKRAKEEILLFLKQSEEAENAGDMRLADQLAERANILAKELQSGQ